jgi:hypothetical protein
MVLLLAGVAVLVFGNAVETFWHFPQESYFLIGGLVPSSDADSWLEGGWRILQSENLSSFDQRRPINAALHAFRLVLTGNLQDSIMLAAIVAGACTIFSALALRQSLGWLSCGVFFIAALELIRDHLPLTMTEVHGFIFGCLAFGLLWRSAVDRSISAYAIGLALLSISLNVRSGAFFVLPAVLLWGMLNLSTLNRYSMKALGVGVLGIACGFIVSKLFLLLWSAGDNIQQSNFSLTLYGMAVGGKGWTQAFLDHPEIIRGNFGGPQEGTIAKALYRIAIQEIVDNPSRFVFYYLAELERFVRLFMKYDLNISRLVTVIAGIWVLVRWREPVSQLCIFLFLGIMFSAPFLMEDAGVRPFASVFPVFAAMPAVAMGLILRFLLIRILHYTQPVVENLDRPKGMVAIGLFSLIMLVVGPVVAVSIHKPQAWSGAKCPENETGIVLSGYNSVVVNVVNSNHARIPNISHNRLIDTFPGSQGEHHRMEMMEISPPFSLASVYVPEYKRREYLKIEGPILWERELIELLCVQTIDGNDYRKAKWVKH